MRRYRHLTLFLLFVAAATDGRARVDVPTWQAGDWWDVERTFTLTVATTGGMEAELDTTENYRLTVAEVIDLPTSAGVVRAYRRERSQGAVSGQGTVRIADIPVNLRWDPALSSSGGVVWNAAGDLSRVSEEYSLNAVLEAQVIAWLKLATVDLDVRFEFVPAYEIHDFPLGADGEAWATTVTQRVVGHVSVVWEDSPLWQGNKPDDIDRPFDQSSDVHFTYSYAGQEARGGFADTYRIDMQPGGSLWYEPSIEDFVEMMPADIDIGSSGSLTNLVVRVLDSSLGADPSFSIDGFDPQLPHYGESVSLTGSTAEGVTVIATILGENETAQAVAGPGGSFSILLLAPDHDDHTPANDDGGSFGVEVEAGAIGRRIVTLQLFLPPTRTHPRWHLYR